MSAEDKKAAAEAPTSASTPAMSTPMEPVDRVRALSAKSHTVFCTVVTSATLASSGSHLVPTCLDRAQVSTWPICRTSHVA
jgi:hypothetical protein